MKEKNELNFFTYEQVYFNRVLLANCQVSFQRFLDKVNSFHYNTNTIAIERR